MIFGLAAPVLGGLLAGAGSLISGISGARSAKKASSTQAASAQQGIAAQQAQFAAIQKLLQPYVKGGQQAFAGQQALLGLSGAPAQAAAIRGISRGPEFAALAEQGEEGILQNASATGGLRGGNVQAALAQFRPQLLQQLIQQRFQQLGGLASIGQNAAAGVGNAGQATGANVAQLLQQQGAARAGGIVQGNPFAQLPGALASGLGAYAGLGGIQPGQPTNSANAAQGITAANLPAQVLQGFGIGGRGL